MWCMRLWRGEKEGEMELEEGWNVESIEWWIVFVFRGIVYYWMELCVTSVDKKGTNTI